MKHSHYFPAHSGFQQSCPRLAQSLIGNNAIKFINLFIIKDYICSKVEGHFTDVLTTCFGSTSEACQS